ncbi:aldehyde dehydrogenase family protein [Nocardia sp. NPDC049707]|uniref:aldehyde dehydrogenase family protein n=1 Tax=Nocardia sp. NPDC049707 TaxID=3154735 RepID=UPI00343DCBF0
MVVDAAVVSDRRGSPEIDFHRDYLMTIGGQLCGAPTTFGSFNPADRTHIARVPDASREQLDHAIDAARTAFLDWSRTPLADRQAAVSRIGDLIEQHAEEFMALLTREQGKPRADAEFEIFGSHSRQSISIRATNIGDDLMTKNPHVTSRTWMTRTEVSA